MKFGVVIVTYNRLELLKECVDACLHQTYPFESIIIVNNCSTDGTDNYLKTLKDKKLTIINCETNLGGAGGFYEGIKKATEMNLVDYLLIIDDDAIINKDYNKYINAGIDNSIKEGKNILAFSGTVETDGIILTSTRKNINDKYEFVPCDVEEYKKDFFDYEVSSFCGLYVSMEIVKKIGLPKKEFFIWYDDTEYCMRIRKHTIIRNINKSVINHKAPIQSATGINWKSYYGIRNKLYVEKTYFPKRIYLKHSFKNYLRAIKNKLKYIIKRDKKYNNISKIYFWSTFDFIRNKYGFNEKFSYLTMK